MWLDRQKNFELQNVIAYHLEPAPGAPLLRVSNVHASGCNRLKTPVKQNMAWVLLGKGVREGSPCAAVMGILLLLIGEWTVSISAP